MDTRTHVALFSSIVVAQQLATSAGGFERYFGSLFNDVDLEGKRVLDIGSGTGIHGIGAACAGARSIVCVEPCHKEHTMSSYVKLKDACSQLHAADIRLEVSTFQDFHGGVEKYDIVLLHNSINHLNEAACEKLHLDEAAQNAYGRLFLKMYEMMTDGAKIIITDCSRYNLFPLLGLRNAFAPSIEWHKHQPPGVWVSLLEKAGFSHPVVSWHAFGKLGSVGKALFANKWMSFFQTSHFRLVMDKCMGSC